MAGSYTEWDYNYGHQNVSTLINQHHIWFDQDVSGEIKDYIRVVIRSEKTEYDKVNVTKYMERVRSIRPKKVTIDEARLVILGGEFEKVGGSDEDVGGGNQKVGSAHK